MDSKLELFLNKVNLSKEDYKYFNDAKLLKIIASKDKKNWNFVIETKDLLPVSVLEYLDQNIKNGFPNLNVVTYSIKTINVSNSKVNDYYSYVINTLGLGKALSMVFYGKSIKFTTNGLVLEASNKAEENVMNNKIKDIVNKYKQIGFSDFSLSIYLIKEESHLKESIESEFNEEVKETIKTFNHTKSINDRPKERMQMVSTKKDPDSNAILGFEISDESVKINTVTGEINDVTIEGYIFGKELFESTKSVFKIITLKVSDLSDSILVKIFFRNEEDFNRVNGELNENSWYKINGRVSFDTFANDYVLSARNIVPIESKFKEEKDTEKEKRVELHAHTIMSQMDGVVSVEDLIKQAKKWGHRGIAVTDHDGVQAFPNAFNLVRGMNKDLKEGEEPFKVIYGCELVMVDDNIDIVIRPTDEGILDATYVVFDLETTGFNAGGADSIIEIGATKIRNGEILDSFDELIDPKRKLPQKIIDVTHITDDMLVGKMNEEEGVKKFIEWIGGENVPMVAHNAKFDVSFIEMAYKKYDLGEFKNPVIDTLELSRALDNTEARHSLSAITKRYGVVFDEDAHHRANYDAEGTALVLHKMLKKMYDQNFRKISELNNLVPKDEIHKYGKTHDINILTITREGLKNLFTIVSYANTKYLYKTPRILRSEIEKYRKGLLIGSGCYQSEVFTSASTKSDEELANIIKFYDYVEVQPVDEYCHLVPSVFENEAQLIQNIEKIVRVTEEAGKMIVATGDVHHLKKEDKIYREIIINQNVPGRGRHPLIRNSKGGQIPSQHFRTTNEMLENFEFLGKEKAKELVITNPNKILDMTEVFDVIIQTGGVPFSPRVKADDGKTYLDCPRVVTDLVYEKANDWYGDPLPYNIESRLGTELYGDIVLTSVKYYLDKSLSDEEKEIESFKQLHDVIVKGSDAVKDLVRKYLVDTSEEELTGDELEKKLKKSLKK